MRTAALVGGVLILASVVLMAAGVTAGPLSRTCAAPVSGEVCAETVEAALERGLAPFHPLILASHVEPGPAAASLELGHKATVTFDLLGVPGTTSVRLYLDMGGHWGGVVDRDDLELAGWALAPLVLSSVVAVGLLAAVRRRHATGSG